MKGREADPGQPPRKRRDPTSSGCEICEHSCSFGVRLVKSSKLFIYGWIVESFGDSVSVSTSPSQAASLGHKGSVCFSLLLSSTTLVGISPS